MVALHFASVLVHVWQVAPRMVVSAAGRGSQLAGLARSWQKKKKKAKQAPKAPLFDGPLFVVVLN